MALSTTLAPCKSTLHLTAFKSPCPPALLGLGGLFIEVLVYPIFFFFLFLCALL